MLGAVLLQQQRWSLEELLFSEVFQKRNNLIAREEVFYNISESLSQEATLCKSLC